MTRVDFYVLTQQAANAGSLFACRLTEKAYTSGHSVYIHTATADQAAALDELLWSYRPGSFLPHDIYDGSGRGTAPILLGWHEQPEVLLPRGPDDPSEVADAAQRAVLINLADTVPLFFSRFRRVAEMVAGAEDERARARERFRFYRDRGYPLNSHNI